MSAGSKYFAIFTKDIVVVVINKYLITKDGIVNFWK